MAQFLLRSSKTEYQDDDEEESDDDSEEEGTDDREFINDNDLTPPCSDSEITLEGEADGSSEDETIEEEQTMGSDTRKASSLLAATAGVRKRKRVTNETDDEDEEDTESEGGDGETNDMGFTKEELEEFADGRADADEDDFDNFDEFFLLNDSAAHPFSSPSPRQSPTRRIRATLSPTPSPEELREQLLVKEALKRQKEVIDGPVHFVGLIVLLALIHSIV